MGLFANSESRRGECTNLRRWAYFFVAVFLFVGGVQKVSAENAKSCDTDYILYNFECVAAPTSCDPDAAQDVKDAYGEVNGGELSGYTITGVCPEKQVCCRTKPEPAAKPAAGGAAAGTADCDANCQAIKAYIKENYEPPKNKDGTKFEGPLPDCAYSGTCREANDLLQLIINQGKMIFGIIGMIALAAFVYGGFLMVFSFGSADKVKQGKDVMIAAVVGIIIVFSAYLIVAFILGALGVNEDFKGIK